jgi:aerobic-type carbon monoxide dehydrogenase small subunit (CoxS/CutS family)
MIRVTVNGRPVEVDPGTTVAAAVMRGQSGFRRSVTGELRGPLCGMGICMECRVTLNGRPHERSCQLLCAPGMEILTDA